MEWWVLGLLIMVTVIVLLTLGLPIAVALGLTCFIFLLPVLGMERTLFTIGSEFLYFWGSPTFIVVGLFVLMGELLGHTGSAADIFEVASKWLQRLPGGLALVTIGTCTIFATMSGSHTAAILAMSVICLPQMRKRGYSDRLSCGALSAGGGLAHLIPPSTYGVIYAGLADISLGEMLIAGALPGLLLAVLFAAVCVVWALVNPAAAPVEPTVSWKERFLVLRKTLVPIILVFALLVTIYTGIATVVEAASLGTFVMFVLAIVRRIGWAKFNQALLSTVRTMGFIMFLVVGAKLLSWVISYNLIGQNFLRALLALDMPPMMMIIWFMILYILLGMFVDGIGMLVITVPILLPVVVALGFDPLWYGVLILVNFEMALITPPYGINLFVLKAVAPDVKYTDILWGGLTFALMDLVCLALVMAFPMIALWLPYAMRGTGGG